MGICTQMQRQRETSDTDSQATFRALASPSFRESPLGSGDADTKGYYGFNTKLRYNVFIGQRLRYNIPRRHRNFSKSISLYYELSTCDLYVVSSVPNRHVGFTDILSLALGLRMELF